MSNFQVNVVKRIIMLNVEKTIIQKYVKTIPAPKKPNHQYLIDIENTKLQMNNGFNKHTNNILCVFNLLIHIPPCILSFHSLEKDLTLGAEYRMKQGTEILKV